jgi:Tetratricopeptide repeat
MSRQHSWVSLSAVVAIALASPPVFARGGGGGGGHGGGGGGHMGGGGGMHMGGGGMHMGGGGMHMGGGMPMGGGGMRMGGGMPMGGGGMRMGGGMPMGAGGMHMGGGMPMGGGGMRSPAMGGSHVQNFGGARGGMPAARSGLGAVGGGAGARMNPGAANMAGHAGAGAGNFRSFGNTGFAGANHAGGVGGANHAGGVGGANHAGGFAGANHAGGFAGANHAGGFAGANHAGNVSRASGMAGSHVTNFNRTSVVNHSGNFNRTSFNGNRGGNFGFNNGFGNRGFGFNNGFGNRGFGFNNGFGFNRGFGFNNGFGFNRGFGFGLGFGLGLGFGFPFGWGFGFPFGWGFGYPFGWGFGGLGYGGFGYGGYGGWGGYGLCLPSWNYGSSLYGYGYSSYINPYYSGVGVAAGAYDYAQPINTVAAPAASAEEEAAALFSAGRESFKQSDYGTALRDANDALAKTPNDSALHEFRALCLFALGRYDEAATTLYAVLAVGPGWDWATMISLYPNVETYTAHLRALEGHCNAHPQTATARFVLAYHYLTEGFLDSAAKILEQVVALKPNDTISKKLLEQLDAAQANKAGGAAALNPLPAAIPNDTKVPDGATIFGAWTSQPTPDTSIALTVDQGGTFTWKVTQKGQPQQFSGTAVFGGNVLTLVQDTGPPLVGRVSWKDTTHMAFRIVGSGADDPGLSFAK